MTPLCKSCGARHYNFDPCPSGTGTSNLVRLPGYRPVKASTVPIFPVPPGYRIWGDHDEAA